MESAGRLLTRDWNEYDYGNAVVRPTDMEPPRCSRIHPALPALLLAALDRQALPPPVPCNRTEALFYAIAN